MVTSTSLCRWWGGGGREWVCGWLLWGSLQACSSLCQAYQLNLALVDGLTTNLHNTFTHQPTPYQPPSAITHMTQITGQAHF